MDRRLIIDGNAVYEIDENCMLKKQLQEKQKEKNAKKKTAHAIARESEEEEVLTIYKMKRTE